MFRTYLFGQKVRLFYGTLLVVSLKTLNQLALGLTRFLLYSSNIHGKNGGISLRVRPRSSFTNIRINDPNIFESIRIGPRQGWDSGYLMISLHSSLLYQLRNLAWQQQQQQQDLSREPDFSCLFPGFFPYFLEGRDQKTVVLSRYRQFGK